MAESNSLAESTDVRWESVLARKPLSGDGFVYAVKTTGVYCRSGCASRTPRRRNVEFFDSPEHAEIAGYRACRRCLPRDVFVANPTKDRLIRVCRFIEESKRLPPQAELARVAGVTSHYLLRLFRKHLGVTPREYAARQRVCRLAQALERDTTVTDAILKAGYESTGRCYAEADRVLGMTPNQYRKNGRSMQIRFAIADCSLGKLLVAVTDKGVCRIAIGDEESTLRAELLTAFPAAEAISSDSTFVKLLRQVVRFVDHPTVQCPFPLDIRGTAFQQRVWRALQAVPPGETRTYAALAKEIGRPSATRAVASAVAANTLAVAVPCHRIVRSDGKLGGFRWGVKRKKELLEREEKSSAKYRRK